MGHLGPGGPDGHCSVRSPKRHKRSLPQASTRRVRRQPPGCHTGVVLAVEKALRQVAVGGSITHTDGKSVRVSAMVDAPGHQRTRGGHRSLCSPVGRRCHPNSLFFAGAPSLPQLRTLAHMQWPTGTIPRRATASRTEPGGRGADPTPDQTGVHELASARRYAHVRARSILCALPPRSRTASHRPARAPCHALPGCGNGCRGNRDVTLTADRAVMHRHVTVGG